METGAGASARVCRAEHSVTGQSAANQRPVLWPADQWEGGTAAGSDVQSVTCLAVSEWVCTVSGALARLASLVSQPSQISDQKLTQELTAASGRLGQAEYFILMFSLISHEFQRKSVRMSEASFGNSWSGWTSRALYLDCLHGSLYPLN